VFDASNSDAHERRFYLRAMGGQAHHLRHALASNQPWGSIVARYPELEEVAEALAGPHSVAGAREAVVDLYRRYCGEWGAFAAAVAGPHGGAPDGNPANPVGETASLTGDLVAPPAAPVRQRIDRLLPDLWTAADAGWA
jgi:nitroreductase